MQITTFFTSDADYWAIFTEGHVSKDLFLQAARNTPASDLEYLEDGECRKFTSKDVDHLYMNQNSSELDEDGQPLWNWCRADDPGAVAVTAVQPLY